MTRITDPLWRELEALGHTPTTRALNVVLDGGAAFDDHFGVCPACHDRVCYNIGPDHWFACDAHRVRWYVGSNLFSAWRQESEEEWGENWEKIEPYDEIEPYSPAWRPREEQAP